MLRVVTTKLFPGSQRCRDDSGNKFERYRGNERADKRVEEIYARHQQAFHDREKHRDDARILTLPEFVPCQKFLSETQIAL